MMPIQCLDCKNYIGGSKCKAFPTRIPAKIMTGEEIHDKVRKGQKGNFVFKDVKI